MSRPSTIDQLPADILEQLQALLRDPRVSQLEATARINAVLEELGEETVSKSAVNRYAVRMEEVGTKLRQSRAVADMWIAKLGAQPQGKLGHLVNEMLRTLAFDLSIKLQEGHLDTETMPAVISQIKELSLTMMRLEKAANLNVEREREIREQALEDAAANVEQAAEAKGMGADQVKFWRDQVLRGL